jgi:hypothetical protein
MITRAFLARRECHSTSSVSQRFDIVPTSFATQVWSPGGVQGLREMAAFIFAFFTGHRSH